MGYSITVDFRKCPYLMKQQIISFYHEFENFLDKVQDVGDYRCSNSFEVGLEREELKTTFNSYNEFNNEILSYSKITYLQGFFMRIKDNEKYVISLFYGPGSFFVIVTGESKLWVDETSSGIRKSFNKMVRKESLSSKKTVGKITNKNESQEKKEIYKDPMFIVATLSLIVTALGVYLAYF